MIKKISLGVVCFVFFFACSENSDDSITTLTATDSEINTFIWEAMNDWYYWQSDVPILSDNLSGTEELGEILDEFDQPESFFSSLIHSDDRFSWIVDDYIALENSFQGISSSYGYEFGLVEISNNQLIGYVQYVVEGGPAESKGIVRGDLFSKVDQVTLNRDNYISLLFGANTTYTLTLAELDSSGSVTELNDVSLTAETLEENPIFKSEVIEHAGINVGYLSYNQFVSSNIAHRELNGVFQNFKQSSIEELVLDLRYNPGGSLETAIILASMIYGAADTTDILGTISYNEKLIEANDEFFLQDYFFYNELPIEGGVNEELNRLDIDRLFILTGTGTASASEVIISGLRPYMDVVLVGSKTVGKDLGSLTLYDSPSTAYLDRTDVNPGHTYAIQPIVARIANSQGLTNYVDGFLPDWPVNEVEFIADLKPLGDINEPLFSTALSVIDGSARIGNKEQSDIPQINSRLTKNPHLAVIRIN